MSDIGSYARQHRLILRYGFGLALAAATAGLSAFFGEPSGIVALKAIATVPFALALMILPMIFGENALRPFTPAFFERGVLMALLLGSWIALLSWRPDMDWFRATSLLAISAGTYISFHLAGGWLARRRSHQTPKAE